MALADPNIVVTDFGLCKYELGLDHRFNEQVAGFANYSWQDEPKNFDDDNLFPP